MTYSLLQNSFTNDHELSILRAFGFKGDENRSMSKSIQIEGRSIIVRSGLVKTAVVRDEWYRDVEDSQALVKAVRQQTKADILTYLQRPSAARVEHDWYQEKFPVAMLPISSYKHWYEKQIDKSARRAIREPRRPGLKFDLLRLTMSLQKE
jgi:hypothetical protein